MTGEGAEENTSDSWSEFHFWSLPRSISRYHNCLKYRSFGDALGKKKTPIEESHDELSFCHSCCRFDHRSGSAANVFDLLH